MDPEHLGHTPVLRQRAAAKNWVAVAMLAPKASARPRQSRSPKAGPDHQDDAESGKRHDAEQGAA